MATELEIKLAGLRAEFLVIMVERMALIRTSLQAINDGGEDAASELIAVVHKLSGSGGTFGFTLVSDIAGDMETLLLDGNRDTARLGRLADGLQTLLDTGENQDPETEAILRETLSGDLAP